MIRNYLYGVFSFVLGFVILCISVLRSAEVSPAYGYASAAPSLIPTPTAVPQIGYGLPYPGRILPDNLLWYTKALRDRIQYLFARDSLKKAELALLYSDKRLGASQTLFEKNKPDLGVSVLTKGEKYLEIASKNEEDARKKGIDTAAFLSKLANSSLKHRQVIEEKILLLAPEDIRPEIVKAEDYSKNSYKKCRDALNSKGLAAPKDPFNWQ